MIRIAAWILRTFGSGPSIDTLIGDLAEEYRAGKSAAWLLTQALVAIPSTFLAAVQAHKLLTLRAVALALVVMTMVNMAIEQLRPWIVAATEVYLPAHEPYWVSTYEIVNGVRVVGDQRVALYWNTFVYDPLIRLGLIVLGALIVGALVRRTHRSIGAASVLAATAALVLLALAQYLYVRPSLPADGPRLALLGAGWWLTWNVWVGATVAAFMIGGFSGHRRNDDEPPLSLDCR